VALAHLLVPGLEGLPEFAGTTQHAFLITLPAQPLLAQPLLAQPLLAQPLSVQRLRRQPISPRLI